MDDGSVLLDNEGQKHIPRTDDGFSTMIARSRTDSVGSAVSNTLIDATGLEMQS
jgi:hypothetical protein